MLWLQVNERCRMYLGEKEFAASPPLFDKRSGCYGNGLIEAEEKPKILKKVFDNAGRVLS